MHPACCGRTACNMSGISNTARCDCAAARAYAARVFRLRMLTVKNSRKRSAARSPALAMSAGTSGSARAGSARAGLDAAALLRVLFHQRVEKRFRDSKSCPPKTVDRLSKVNQAAPGGKIENPQRASHTESLAASYNYALPIIHEQQIGVERNGQGDCGCLPNVRVLPQKPGRIDGLAFRGRQAKPEDRQSSSAPKAERPGQSTPLARRMAGSLSQNRTGRRLMFPMSTK